MEEAAASWNKAMAMDDARAKDAKAGDTRGIGVLLSKPTPPLPLKAFPEAIWW